jgi:predicted ester cyclase
MRRRFTAFSDLHVAIDETIGEGDNVGIWYTAKGTHRGEFEGVSPAGRQVNWFGFDFYALRGARSFKPVYR